MAAPSPVPPSPPQPTLDCDLVMKGGITSGLVYPKAVVRIARDYHIHSIGGTSVGAIAAGLTAAAEYWRRKNPGLAEVQQDQIDTIVTALDSEGPDGKRGWDDFSRDDVRAAEQALLDPANQGRGFAGLYAIPQEVGYDLLGKFHPTPQTRGAFQFLVALLEAKSTPARAVVALTRQFYLIRTLAALFACLLALALARDPSLGIWPLALLVAAGFAILLWDRFRAFRPAPKKPAPPPATGPATTPPSEQDRWTRLKKIALAFWPALAAGAFALAWWAVIVGLGIGWGTTFSWIGDNWPLVIAIALGIGVAANATDARRWLARWLGGGDPAKQATYRKYLDAGSAALGGVVLAAFLWWQWGPITDDPDTFGPLAVGAALGWVTGGAIGLLLNALVFIPANNNGICTGLQAPDGWLPRRFPRLQAWLARLPGHQARSVALTNWLTAKLDTMAGKTDSHLTFGDLDTAYIDPDNRPTGITLEAVTSELRRGLPLNIPRALDRYGFKPKEFQRFFPASVVTALVDAAKASWPDDRTLRDIDAGSCTIVRFPRRGAGVPVVVGVRMSDGFPLLFSTVPVYHLGRVKPDAGQRDGEDAGPGDLPEPPPAPLADGGIVSNFPIHKFDRALSPWPTFAIDLIAGVGDSPATPSDAEHEINYIRAEEFQIRRDPSTSTAQSSADMVLRTSDAEPVHGLLALAKRILDTARGWMDNSQKTLPGYAERIVGIRLYNGEGGLNLTMDHQTIERLANRGMRGVDRLVGMWSPARETESQWHQHRWLRYRILMRSLENMGQEWKAVYAAPPASGGSSIRDLVGETASGGAREPSGFVYSWEDGNYGSRAAQMTLLFDAFANATPGPKAGEPGAEGQPVEGTFDGAIAPIPEPDLLMIPPFE